MTYFGYFGQLKKKVVKIQKYRIFDKVRIIKCLKYKIASSVPIFFKFYYERESKVILSVNSLQ